MKRLTVLIALVFASPVSAQNFPKFEGRFVIDAANVIPDDREDALNKKLIDYQKSTTNEIAVVTVPSLEGYDIESYANTYFRKLGIGNRERNNGVLFLIAPTEHQMRIEVG